MIDKVGNELEIGQSVVYLHGQGLKNKNQLRVGIIARFTEKMVIMTNGDKQFPIKVVLHA